MLLPGSKVAVIASSSAPEQPDAMTTSCTLQHRSDSVLHRSLFGNQTNSLPQARTELATSEPVLFACAAIASLAAGWPIAGRYPLLSLALKESKCLSATTQQANVAIKTRKRHLLQSLRHELVDHIGAAEVAEARWVACANQHRSTQLFRQPNAAADEPASKTNERNTPSTVNPCLLTERQVDQVLGWVLGLLDVVHNGADGVEGALRLLAGPIPALRLLGGGGSVCRLHGSLVRKPLIAAENGWTRGRCEESLQHAAPTSTDVLQKNGVEKTRRRQGVKKRQKP
jgi:hypothetical protein